MILHPKVKHGYREVPEMGDFTSLKASFVISVNFTTCNEVFYCKLRINITAL